MHQSKVEQWLGLRWATLLHAAFTLLLASFFVNLLMSSKYLATVIVRPYSEARRRNLFDRGINVSDTAISSTRLIANSFKEIQSPSSEPLVLASNSFKEIQSPSSEQLVLASKTFKEIQSPSSEPLEVASITWSSGPFPSVDMQRVPGRKFPSVPSVNTAKDWETPPVQLEGQITMGKSFGRELNRMAQSRSVRLVLDIGTWSGGGSSWCLAQVRPGESFGASDGLRSERGRPVRRGCAPPSLTLRGQTNGCSRWSSLNRRGARRRRR